jgi:stage II sporulation protein AB (anti-sigma F factor)
MENTMKLTVPALSENESFVRSTVAAFCVPEAPTLEEINDIKTAVSEAVTNCVVHAYDDTFEKNNRLIEIYAALRKKQVEIYIRDFGRGIENIEQAMQPLFTTRASEERSGMGFSVMQAFCDGVEVESKVGAGTTVRLHKVFSEE